MLPENGERARAASADPHATPTRNDYHIVPALAGVAFALLLAIAVATTPVGPLLAAAWLLGVTA